MTKDPAPPSFEVGPWTVSVGRHEIVRRDGASVQLEPRVMQLLVTLAEADGGVVSRERIIDRVWEGEEASSDSLSVAISELRRSLGDDGRSQCFIKTVPKRGYRLVAELRRPQEETAGSEPPVRDTGRHRARWVAVGVLMAAIVAAVLGWRYAGRSDGAAPAPGVRPLTAFPGTEIHPEFSPDGRQLAFARSRPEDSSLDLWVLTPPDPRPRRLTTRPESLFRPCWSPTGDRLAAVMMEDPGGMIAGRFEIVIVPAAGGDPRSLVEVRRPFGGLCWVDGGRSLVVAAAARAGEKCRLWQVSEKAPSLVPVPGAEELEVPRAPAMSSAGDRLCFITGGHGKAELWELPWPPGTPRRIASGLGAVADLAWLPGDREVVVAVRGTAGFELQIVELADGARRSLGSATKDLTMVAVSSDGELAAQRMEFSSDVWSATLGKSPEDQLEAEKVAPSTRDDISPAPSPDGTRVVFVSDRGGEYELWSADVRDDDATRLLRLPGAMVSQPRWSFDGGRLAVVAGYVGQELVLVVDATSGVVEERITWSGCSLHLGEWLPDGSAVLAVDGVRREMLHCELRSGQCRSLGVAADRVVAVMPEGAAAVIDHCGELYVHDLDRGTTRPFAHFPEVVQWGRSAAGGRWLVGVSRDAPTSGLLRVALATAAAERVGRIHGVEGEVYDGLTIDADGRRVWFSGNRSSSECDLVSVRIPGIGVAAPSRRSGATLDLL